MYPNPCQGKSNCSPPLYSYPPMSYASPVSYGSTQFTSPYVGASWSSYASVPAQASSPYAAYASYPFLPSLSSLPGHIQVYDPSAIPSSTEQSTSDNAENGETAARILDVLEDSSENN